MEIYSDLAVYPHRRYSWGRIYCQEITSQLDWNQSWKRDELNELTSHHILKRRVCLPQARGKGGRLYGNLPKLQKCGSVTEWYGRTWYTWNVMENGIKAHSLRARLLAGRSWDFYPIVPQKKELLCPVVDVSIVWPNQLWLNMRFSSGKLPTCDARSPNTMTLTLMCSPYSAPILGKMYACRSLTYCGQFRKESVCLSSVFLHPTCIQ